MPRKPTKGPERSPPPGFVLGKDVGLDSWGRYDIAVDLEGRAHCVVGYVAKTMPDSLSYFSPSVAARDQDGRRSYGFVRLTKGALARSFYLRDDGHYRILEDRHVLLPRGAQGSWGVVSLPDHKLDVDLTRSLFGATEEDLISVAVPFAHLAGRGVAPSAYRPVMHHFPRITFSKTRANHCGVTGCLIPQNFPYLALEHSQFDWSHVSLYGFYRLLALLCHSGSLISRRLIEDGVDSEVLSRLASNGDPNLELIMPRGWWDE